VMTANRHDESRRLISVPVCFIVSVIGSIHLPSVEAFILLQAVYGRISPRLMLASSRNQARTCGHEPGRAKL
jgi:hypothetical protein